MDLNKLHLTFMDSSDQVDKRPSNSYLRHIQVEAHKMEELLNTEEAVKHIESALEPWPDIIEGEIQKFMQDIKKSK